MIELSGIRKTYPMGNIQVRALQEISLYIARGEFVAIMGPSGSGKSTLMHILGLLDAPDEGSFLLDGREVRDLDEDERAVLRASTIGFVFQQFNLLPRVSARDNVALPLIYAASPAAASPDALLDRVGLGDRKRHAPNELSGGQQQRVAIARALVNSPSILMADEPTGNLDSASSAEILRILKDLHRSGLTVIVVTHDAEVAQIADRTITMKDGRVAGDSGRIAGAMVAAMPPPVQDRNPTGGKPATLQRRWREAASLLRQAGRSLAANKTRTALSMLGVLIGVAAVIAVMALGAGARDAVQQRIASMGANLLVLMPQRHQSAGVSLGAGAVSRLTLDDAEAVRTEITGARNVSATVRGAVQAAYENRNWRTTLRGAEPAYETIHAMTPQAGRFFTPAEVASRSRVAVIGLTVCKELFGDANPVGKTIRINRDSFEVIGLLPDKGSSAFMDENDQVIIPVSTAMRRVLGQSFIGEIEIQVESAALLGDVERDSVALMLKRHRVSEDNDDAFHIRNMADFQSMMTSTSRTMSVLLTGISAISLLVGGIGIMNIMLVSVTERTREIGIRKAVGARRADILIQFLVESVAVSTCGGLAGMALGAGASLVMSRAAGWAVCINPLTLLTAFSFSALVGIVFGLWPARNAAALQPIAALRYE
jgi:macrolide transport system ATP-binding/permease protein